MASVVSLTALKATAQVDLDDERKVRQRGFDLIYEARDLDLDQSTRDGLTQYRKNIDSTRARVKEAENIIDNKLEPFIKKKYWWVGCCIHPLHMLCVWFPAMAVQTRNSPRPPHNSPLTLSL